MLKSTDQKEQLYNLDRILLSILNIIARNMQGSLSKHYFEFLFFFQVFFHSSSLIRVNYSLLQIPRSLYKKHVQVIMRKIIYNALDISIFYFIWSFRSNGRLIDSWSRGPCTNICFVNKKYKDNVIFSLFVKLT